MVEKSHNNGSVAYMLILKLGNSCDHQIDLLFGEFWIHWQGQDLVTGPFRNRELSTSVCAVGIEGLQVDRLGVVNSRADPMFFKIGLQDIALLGLDHI